MKHPAAPVLALLLAFTAAPADAHRHAGPQADGTEPTATGTARHATDAALRTAMERVRNAVGAFEHARHGHMGPEQVRALSAHLDEQVLRVFRECRLPPREDASLHVILATLAKASRAMRERPGDFAPVDAMERALADYARMFDDPAAGSGGRR